MLYKYNIFMYIDDKHSMYNENNTNLSLIDFLKLHINTIRGSIVKKGGSYMAPNTIL